eukprot:TRINITY_DN29761_c0_g1_i1.p1 TRINITY_DN29761_c0_g1~~TRINITY_DN29761_c0_g1_i1.p1  ORF type:complete len:208 (+),score=4.94 TRINITY_DN29761_c0_g1_i1:73-624(+)
MVKRSKQDEDRAPCASRRQANTQQSDHFIRSPDEVRDIMTSKQYKNCDALVRKHGLAHSDTADAIIGELYKIMYKFKGTATECTLAEEVRPKKTSQMTAGISYDGRVMMSGRGSKPLQMCSASIFPKRTKRGPPQPQVQPQSAAQGASFPRYPPARAVGAATTPLHRLPCSMAGLAPQVRALR